MLTEAMHHAFLNVILLCRRSVSKYIPYILEYTKTAVKSTGDRIFSLHSPMNNLRRNFRRLDDCKHTPFRPRYVF